DKRQQQMQAGFQSGVIPAEPLHDPGFLLRHNFGRSVQHNDDCQYRDEEKDECGHDFSLYRHYPKCETVHLHYFATLSTRYLRVSSIVSTPDGATQFGLAKTIRRQVDQRDGGLSNNAFEFLVAWPTEHFPP